MSIFPVITKEIQQQFEARRVADGTPDICGYFGRACRQLDDPEGANRALCDGCPLKAFAETGRIKRGKQYIVEYFTQVEGQRTVYFRVIGAETRDQARRLAEERHSRMFLQLPHIRHIPHMFHVQVHVATQERLIAAIARRTYCLRWYLTDAKPSDIEAAVTAAHRVFNLRLAELLETSEYHFSHDVNGILKNYNAEAGTFENHFVPRYANNQ